MTEPVGGVGQGSRAPPSAVLFDLDGTLVDSAPGLAVATNGALAALGLPPISRELTRAFVGRGARDLLRRALAASGGSPDRLDEAHALFLDHYLGPCADPSLNRPFPGAIEALDALGSVPLGLTTNKPTRHARRMLDALDLSSRFGVVLGGDDAPRKPDPAMLWRALERLGADREGAWVVGDSAVDAEAARRAGLRLALVTFGYADADVATLGAELVVDDLRELVPALLGPTTGR